MTTKCPICKSAVVKANPEFPFCSERCRTLDLGNWAMERYVISSPPEDDDEEERPQLPGAADDED